MVKSPAHSYSDTRVALWKTKLIFPLETLTPYFEHNLKRQKELDYLQCTELILIVR